MAIVSTLLMMMMMMIMVIMTMIMKMMVMIRMMIMMMIMIIMIMMMILMMMIDHDDPWMIQMDHPWSEWVRMGRIGIATARTGRDSSSNILSKS